MADGVRTIAHDMDETFACPDNPLLLSVRSGAAVSIWTVPVAV